MSKISNNKRNEFNTACAVYDPKADKLFYGKNRGIELNGSPKNPLLFGEDGKPGILSKSTNFRYGIGNCAEVDAINNALNAGSSLGDLSMIVIHANDTRRHRMGDSKPSCADCTRAFKGVIKNNYSGWEAQ